MAQIEKIKSHPEEARARRKKIRVALFASVSLALLAVIAVFGIAAKVGWSLTHPERLAVEQTPAAVGLAYEEVSFKSREDGLNIKGWLVRAPGNRMTVVFAHGYRKNRLQSDVPLLPAARSLVDKGCNVLMFDFRNSGESEGSLTSVGQFEVRDLLGAVDFVKSRAELNQKVVLFGFSMGASTSILAGAREPAVAAVIADAPFADLQDYLMKNLSVWTDLPAFPFNRAFLIVAPPLTGLKAETVSPVNEVKNLNGRPLLLIHGEADRDIPVENSLLLKKEYPAASLWLVPGAGHVKSYAAAGDLYIQKVTEFLDPGSGFTL